MAKAEKTINFDKIGFDKQVKSFDASSGTVKISEKIELLSRSGGDTIEKINECLEGYNRYCELINDIFSATSSYLHKASMNIKDCEVENTTE